MGPRKLPAQLPRLRPEVCLDERLQNVRVQASRAALQDARRTQRAAEQTEVARKMARERGLAQLEEMARACLHSRLVEDRTRERIIEKEAKRKRDEDGISQLAIAIRLGDVPVGAQPELLKRADRVVRQKRPHLTKREHSELLDLALDMNQSGVAKKMGVSKSTVCRHLNRPKNYVDGRGRKHKMTEEMIWAGARFMFITKQSTWKQCASFLSKAYDVSISTTLARKRIKGKCGFRKGDFRRYPPKRNCHETIESRYKFAMDMPEKYGDCTLFESIYYDEMYITKGTKRKAWTVVGWSTTVAEEPTHESDDIHLSLLLAASPSLGIIYYEILEGPVGAQNIREFFEATIAAYVEKFPEARSQKRALLMDNVRSHHTQVVLDYLKGDVISQLVGLEYLPPYSPFLNPLEEVFGYIKSSLWQRSIAADRTNEDRQFLKKSMTEVIKEKINPNMVRKFFFHCQEFLKYAREKAPVYTQQLYESSHIGDEAMLCPILHDDIEALLDSYLPHRYEEFTAQRQALVERQFGVKRLTMTYVDEVINARLPGFEGREIP